MYAKLLRLVVLLRDYLRISIQMIGSHKLRSFLSVTGIIFGILTLLVTLAIGEGTRQKIMRTIEAMGVNLIYVTPQMASADFEHQEYRALTLADSDRLAQLQGVTAYAPVLSSALLLKVGSVEKVVTVDGTTTDYQAVRELAMNRGRFIAGLDVAQKNHVVVLGYDLADQLYGGLDPVGRTLSLWDARYQIVGVLAKKGRTVGVDFDQQILMPITLLQEIQGRPSEVQGIWIRAARSNLTKEVMLQVRKILGRSDMDIWDQEALLAKKDRIARAFKWALGSIAFVSLLIGGIGIMNVLLVSVAERIKEIGLRKAVGASSWDILFQFMFESIVLTLIGGVAGILLGVLTGDYVAWALNVWLPSPEKWEAVLSWSAVGAAVHFTFWVGLLFGLYPAWKAARLDPCEALAYY